LLELVGLLDKFASQEFNLPLLSLFFHLVSFVPGLVYLIIDLLEAGGLLLNGGVKLHSVLGGVLQGLLQVRNLSRQLPLGGLVLGVFLLDLREVLELDGFSFEDSSFHVLDHLLLLLPQLFVP